MIDRQIRSRQPELESLAVFYEKLRSEAELEENEVGPSAGEGMQKLREEWSIALQLAAKLRGSSSSLQSDEDSQQSESKQF